MLFHHKPATDRKNAKATVQKRKNTMRHLADLDFEDSEDDDADLMTFLIKQENRAQKKRKTV